MRATASLMAVCMTLLAALPLGSLEARAAAAAPAGGDITSLITVNNGRDDIVLKGGDYVITIPSKGPRVQQAPELPAVPETVYHGVISGTGTITVKPPAGGRGALVLTNTSTWSLPLNRLRTWSNRQPFARYQYDGVVLNGGKSPWDVDVMHGGTNDPVMTIARGAIVHLNDLDGPRASIESYLGPGGRSTGAYNVNHIRVDGALVFTNTRQGPYSTTIGPLSGTGDFINHQGGFRMSGTSTISGHLLLYGANINGAWARGELTGASSIYNALDLAFGAPPRTVAPAGETGSSSGTHVVPQTIYECCYGNAVYNIGAGEVRFTGTYSYSDSQDQLNPALSNPKLNYVAFPKGNSQRRLDLAQGITTLGDGTDSEFWLPSGAGNAYIGTHKAYALGFDYNGTVRMNVPINSATAIDGLNLFVHGTPGNRVIVTQPLYYHGFTRIDPGAVLQLGDGTPGNKISDYRFYNKQIQGIDTGTYSTSGGSGRVLTADTPPGAPGDRIITNGRLVVANARGSFSGVGALSLSDISGRGGLEQRGPATLTLLSHISYRGPTTISGGTLVLARSRRGAASLALSSGVRLTGRKAVLETRLGTLRLRGLAGVAGSRVLMNGRPLILDQDGDTTFAGSVAGTTGTGTGLVKSGTGTLALEGRVALGRRAVGVDAGSVVLGRAPAKGRSGPRTGTVDGPVTVSGPGTLRVVRGTAASLATAGSTELAGPLTLRGALTQASSGTLRALPGGTITTPGPVVLAGSLVVPDAAPPGPTPLIDNAGSAQVQGTFSGLPEGARLKVVGGSAELTITYRGGDGNDVVLAAAAGSRTASLADGLVGGSLDRLGGRPLLLATGTALLLATALAAVLRRRRRKSTDLPA